MRARIVAGVGLALVVGLALFWWLGPGRGPASGPDADADADPVATGAGPGSASAGGGPPGAGSRTAVGHDGGLTGSAGAPAEPMRPDQPGPPAGPAKVHAKRLDDDMRERIEEAVDRARAWYVDADHGDAAGAAALIGDVLWRRHALDGMEVMADRVSAAVQAGKIPRVFSRLSFTNAPGQLPDFLALPSKIDQITISILHCDRVALSPGLVAPLSDMIGGDPRGQHMVLQALLWADDNGCQMPELEALREPAIEAAAALVDPKPPLTSAEIHAAALLAMAGQGDRVSARFLDGLLDAQRADGGWVVGAGGSDAASQWDPTAFALLALLEQVHAPRGTFVAQ